LNFGHEEYVSDGKSRRCRYGVHRSLYRDVE
jgi:hypothetical protein